MEFLDKVDTLKHQSENSRTVVKSNQIIIKSKSLNMVEKSKDKFVNNLNSNDKSKVLWALWDLALCFQVDPSIASLIEQRHIANIIQMMQSANIKEISLAFNFLNHFIRSDPTKIPFFIQTNTLYFAIKKIPMKSACDFIVTILSLSECLKEEIHFEVYRFFFESQLRHKLLSAFSQLNFFEKQQSYILNILSFLWKNQEDFSRDELEVFLERSDLFLTRADNESTIIYLNFLIKINSPIFYGYFYNFNRENTKFFDLIKVLWEKIKSENNDVCLACFDFLIHFIQFDFQNPHSQENKIEYLKSIAKDISYNISRFLHYKKRPNDVRLSGAKVIETLINIDKDFCIRFFGGEYIDSIKDFLANGAYSDQLIAIRFVSVLMKYNQCEEILNLLKFFDPIDKIIDFLNESDYSLIINLLNCIRNDWDIYIKRNFQNVFLSDIINLMDNQDFIFALQYIESAENEDASHLANFLIKYIEEYKKIKVPENF